MTLPPSWCVKPLKHAALMNSRVLPESTDPDYQFEYIDIGNVNEIGDLTSLQQFRFKDAPSRARRIVVEGDTLISTVRTYLRAIHFVNDPRPDLIGSTGFAVLHPVPGILPEFLSRVVQSTPFVEKVVAHSDGVGYPAINPSALGALPFWFPPEAVQRAIVAFLDRETAKIDALIDKKERLIVLLEEKRAALINRTVTRGLDPSAPMKDSSIPWLGEIPANWEVKRLLYLTPADRPVMYGIVLPGPNVEDGVPIVKGGDVAPGRLRLALLNRTTREIESGYARSRLRAGDIVYAIRGSIGSVELVPEELCGANPTQDAARVSPKPAVDGHWLLYALRAQCTFGQVDATAMGATIRGVNIRDLKRVILPVPPLDEQPQIASHLGGAISTLDEVISKIREQISKFQEYRTAVISAAVTGKIDVRDSAEV